MSASPVTQGAAADAAGRVLAAARAERDGRYAHGGTQAVAEAAAPGGTQGQREHVARLYAALRRQQAGGTAAWQQHSAPGSEPGAGR